jgi:hypothetical protein
LGYVRAPFARPETWLEVGNVACQVRIGVKQTMLTGHS